MDADGRRWTAILFLSLTGFISVHRWLHDAFRPYSVRASARCRLLPGPARNGLLTDGRSRDRDVVGQSPCADGRGEVCASHHPPCTLCGPPDGVVKAAVAVEIADLRYIGRGSPADGIEAAVRAPQNVPDAGRR